MASEELPVGDMPAPPGATHWNIRKDSADGKSERLEHTVREVLPGGAASAMTLSNFHVGTWPGSRAETVDLIRSRWGYGRYRVQFMRHAKGAPTRQIGPWLELVIEDPTPTLAATTSTQATPGSPPGMPPPTELTALFAQMLNQGAKPVAPVSLAGLDPMTQGLVAFQTMIAWQEKARQDANAEADRRVQREREEYERRMAREREERDRLAKEEQERQLRYYRELETLRLNAEAERKRDGTKERIEELQDAIESLAKKKGDGDAPPWWASLVGEIASKMAPGVGELLGEVAKKSVAGGAGAGVIPPGVKPPTGGAT